MASPIRVADTEVGAQRRRFSGACKLRILEEADACKEPGALGALLRRAGLCASHLTTWRAQCAAGGLANGWCKPLSPEQPVQPIGRACRHA